MPENMFAHGVTKIMAGVEISYKELMIHVYCTGLNTFVIHSYSNSYPEHLGPVVQS